MSVQADAPDGPAMTAGVRHPAEADPVAVLAGFARPRASDAARLDDVVPFIVREHAAGLTAAALGASIDELEAASDGLAAYLGAWVADAGAATSRPGGPVPGWDYAFGDLYRTLVNDGGDPVRVLAAVAGHVGACGVPGAWRVRLAAPVRLRWAGWLLPAATEVTVESDAAAARVTVAGAGTSATVSLDTADGRWRAHGRAGELARVARGPVGFDVLTRDALGMRDYEDLLERALPATPPRMLGVFDEALDIIARYTPEYLPWVSRTVHQLFLIAPRPAKVESGSVEHYLGLVHLTAHPEALPVAELLVHEATHQYMNVATKVQPLDDGSDHRTYWSPAVRTQRPVSKIIAALHAFGNVMLFYRRCREGGLPDQAECDRQEALLDAWMDDLVPPVIDNPALTPTGRALCEPLVAVLRP